MPASPLAQDILATPHSVRDVLARLHDHAEHVAAALLARGARRLVALGNGGSLHAAAVSTYLHNALAEPHGTLAWATSTSDFSLFPAPLAAEDAIIGLSVSGELVDLLDLCERLRGRHQLVGVTNEPGATLIRLVDHALVMQVPPNVVPMSSTKTFVASVAALDLLWLALLSGQGVARATRLREELLRLPPQIEQGLQQAQRHIVAAAAALAGCERLFVLGAGPAFSLAQEAALVLKEVALVPAEAVQTREMAQGTLAVVDEQVGVIVVNPPGRGADIGRQVREQCARLGAVTLEIGASPAALALDASCDELLAPLVYAGPLFLLADELGRGRGVDTAHPHWADDYLRLARRQTQTG